MTQYPSSARRSPSSPHCQLRIFCALLAGFGVLLLNSAHAQLNVYVLQVGDGEVFSGYRPMTIREFHGNGTSLAAGGSWTAPSATALDTVTMSVTATTYSHLTRSLDGNYLVFTGRDILPGGAYATATSAVIATFDLQSHALDTSTRISEITDPAPLSLAGDPGRVRSAITTDGTEFWFVGQMQGVSYATLGATTGTRVTTSTVEFGGIQFFDGDIYTSRRAATTRGVWTWSGHPTTSGTGEGGRLQNQSGATGWDTAAGNYGSFDFLNDNYLFIANPVGGVQVFHRPNTENRQWNLLTGANQSLTGLAGEAHVSVIQHDGEVYLFYTAGIGNQQNSLWSVLWDADTATFGTPNLLATAGAGYTFGGVVAIPEPSTFALLFGLGTFGMVVLLRRRKG
jgi:hypothetical protein